MKERPILFKDAMVRAILDGRKTQTRRVVKGVLNNNRLQLKREQMHVLDPRLPCPFGQPGDRLWVRETWAVESKFKHHPPCMIGEDEAVFYRADSGTFGRWRPSIHMPRWASRITLEVTGVRVERLNEISEADALAEGMAVFNGTVYSPHEPEGKNAYSNARGAFGSLWESINGAESWDANPWVWVVEFRRLP